MGDAESYTERTSALDIIVRYAAFFSAFVYGIGFLEEIEYARNLGVGSFDFPLANPRYFVVGTVLLLPCLWSAVLAVPKDIFFSGHHNREMFASSDERFQKIEYFVARVSVFVAVFAASHWIYFVPTIRSLILAILTYVINVIAIKVIRSPDQYLQIGKQVGVILTMATLVSMYSVQCGYAHWCREMRREKTNTRLLIAPEAVEGARALGVAFPSNVKSSIGSPELTEPVRVLYEGERTYVLRLGSGSILQISKDKIWGIAPSILAAGGSESKTIVKRDKH